MRSFVIILLCFGCAGHAYAEPGVSNASPSDIQMQRTGPQDAAYSALDDLIADLMKQWTIPGGALALAERGEVIHWQAFGFADREAQRPVERDTLFRVASVSKPITAVAVLHMIDAEKFTLDTPLKALLSANMLDGAAPNITGIVVRQLLQHSAGWDDGDHDEVALRNDVRHLARLAGPGGIVTPADLTCRRFKRPLDFMPGTDYAYSNFGYVVLGRVVEKVSGISYQDAVKKIVFEGADGDCTAMIGSPRMSGMDSHEAHCYDYPGAQPTEAALAPGQATAWPDGGIATTALDSALGWVASAPCLAAFTDRTFAALHGRPGLLSEKTAREVIARPAPPLWVGTDSYYGLGWRVKPRPEGPYVWHSGSMPGTSALVVHSPKGTSFAVVMNSRPRQYDEFNRQLQQGVEHFLCGK